jgi:F1F0 ATPase subunit 2
MSDFMSLLTAALAGLLLGGFFFAGLRWTVQRALASTRPALWFLESLLLRMGVTLAGFYLIGGAEWRRWLLCLAGFTVARVLLSAERGRAP